MIRTIAIATPVKQGLDTNFMTGLQAALLKRWDNVVLKFYMLGGTCVSFARNELLHYARKEACGEIVYIDSDMGWNLGHLERLLSHVDYDIIGGLYCKRKPGKPVWLYNPKPGEGVNQETNIVEVEDVATGFMKINIDRVFPKLEAAFPHLQFKIQNKDGTPGTCWEFFRIGCDGPRTPEARLAQIKAIMADDTICSDARSLEAIEKACHDEQPASVLRGEDYFFCKMAREVGIKVHLDLGLPPIPHIGDCAFPILPEMVGINVKGQVQSSAVQS